MGDRIQETNKAWGVVELDGFKAEEDLVLNRLTRATIRIWDRDRHHGFSSQLGEGGACALLDEKKVKGAELSGERYGVIPRKKDQRKAADRILLVGDAGGSTPYSMLGFNVIYKNYGDVARQISMKIDSGELDERSLERISFHGDNRFSEVVAPLMIQSVTKLNPADVLDITRKLQERNLFDAFAHFQAYAMDHSIRLRHLMPFVRKFSRLPWRDKAETIRDFRKFLSARDIGKIGYATLKEVFPGKFA